MRGGVARIEIRDEKYEKVMDELYRDGYPEAQAKEWDQEEWQRRYDTASKEEQYRMLIRALHGYN